MQGRGGLHWSRGVRRLSPGVRERLVRAPYTEQHWEGNGYRRVLIDDPLSLLLTKVTRTKFMLLPLEIREQIYGWIVMARLEDGEGRCYGPTETSPSGWKSDTSDIATAEQVDTENLEAEGSDTKTLCDAFELDIGLAETDGEELGVEKRELTPMEKWYSSWHPDWHWGKKPLPWCAIKELGIDALDEFVDVLMTRTIFSRARTVAVLDPLAEVEDASQLREIISVEDNPASCWIGPEVQHIPLSWSMPNLRILEFVINLQWDEGSQDQAICQTKMIQSLEWLLTLLPIARDLELTLSVYVRTPNKTPYFVVYSESRHCSRLFDENVRNPTVPEPKLPHDQYLNWIRNQLAPVVKLIGAMDKSKIRDLKTVDIWTWTEGMDHLYSRKGLVAGGLVDLTDEVAAEQYSVSNRNGTGWIPEGPQDSGGGGALNTIQTEWVEGYISD